ncbi:MAG: hypothetical protein QOI26_2511, partial [Pseudonocardiales bacterium]|nr:hypothetical protein [Pseudonocardiales bacterium]
MRTKHLALRLLGVGLLVSALAVVAAPTAASAAGTNLAIGKTATASSYTDVYRAGNLNDGNQSTYWESANNAFPQWAQIDLGAAASVNQLVLKLPGSTSWATRTETLSVQTSTDGSTFATTVGSAGYTFNPASNNTVTINFTALSTRYVRLNITGNTGWAAGQLSEFEIYGPATTGDTQPPTAPANLAYSSPASGQIALTWSASTDNVGVTGYSVYRNSALLSTVTGTSYTDTAAGTGTVSYYVTARDAAGNVSPASNTVTRNGATTGTNLAIGKPISGSANTYVFTPANANDNDVTTYFEGSTYPSTLTVKLGAITDLSSVVVKLNPDSSWGARTQTIQVLGREQSATGFTALTSPTSYSFSPASGNSVTIPVSGRVSDVQLSITSNSGAPGGQVAEFQIYGSAAPNPDLTITGSSWTPSAPVETDSITVSATVQNAGTLSSAATNVNFYLGATKVGNAAVGALAAGASSTVSVNIGAQTAGSYQLTAKVDESNAVLESNEANNNYTNPSSLTVSAVSSSDLIPVSISWSPTNPAAGNTVTFSAAIKNQGTIASASGTHAVTLTLLDSSGATVNTASASYSGAIAAGATTAPITLGTWTAVNGNYTVKVAVAADANELSVKQANNTVSQAFFVGRGAHMPYDVYEAEDGTIGGGAAIVGPNRTVGDLAGEASGRKAVTLNSTGAYVQWTTRASTNTLVTRFSMPDASGGGGITSNLDIYVNGTFLKAIDLTSKYAWLYGSETSPNNSPSPGTQRHIYDEANIMLGTTVPAGSVIKLQKDSANTSQYAIDFINTEQVSPIANPDATKYVTPAGFSQQNVQDALTAAANDTTKLGVYLPAGDYPVSYKLQVNGRAIKVVGAGPWYTHFLTPSTQDGTDGGFSVGTSANGSTFSGFAFWGNYTSRIDGPGKVFDLTDVSNLTIDNIWVEHTICFVWGTH